MLYIIGLGLGDEEDITVKGLNIVKRAAKVYLEAYTSVLINVSVDALEKFYGREVILADREMVEQQSDEILSGADKEEVAFLVVGDPFSATTHSDLQLRAEERGIVTKVISNVSIMSAYNRCGVQPYSVGQPVSIPFWTDTWRPDSFYDKIAQNLERGLHTLCLLDIKMKEQTVENMMRNRKIFEPPRFMTVAQAATQLLEIISNKKTDGINDLLLNENTVCIGLARVCSDTETFRATTLADMASIDLGGPLHSLIILGQLHPIECDTLKQYGLPTTGV